MIEGIIGRKLGMTQIFTEDGEMVPVTVLEAGPCKIIQKKTQTEHNYNALQLGFGEKKVSRVTKGLMGHYTKHCGQIAESKKKGAPSVKIPLAFVKEIKAQSVDDYQEGQEITVDIFKIGEFVDVVGTSKGKGFAGGVKRHHFRGGDRTHGSMFHRAPGSIGASAYPSRVIKNKKLPGHMGNKRVTAIKLQILELRPEENLLLVRGSVPGPNSGFVIIKKSKREKRI